MSTKNTIIKKALRLGRRSKKQIINEIALEIKSLPIIERIKLALKIVFKGKL